MSQRSNLDCSARVDLVDGISSDESGLSIQIGGADEDGVARHYPHPHRSIILDRESNATSNLASERETLVIYNGKGTGVPPAVTMLMA